MILFSYKCDKRLQYSPTNLGSTSDLASSQRSLSDIWPPPPACQRSKMPRSMNVCKVPRTAQFSNASSQPRSVGCWSRWIRRCASLIVAKRPVSSPSKSRALVWRNSSPMSVTDTRIFSKSGGLNDTEVDTTSNLGFQSLRMRGREREREHRGLWSMVNTPLQPYIH